MFNPLTALTVGLSLALSGAALAKEKIDFMFPAPVDGKLTMEMTRVIKRSTTHSRMSKFAASSPATMTPPRSKPNPHRRPDNRRRW